jgi:hypothetical protein
MKKVKSNVIIKKTKTKTKKSSVVKKSVKPEIKISIVIDKEIKKKDSKKIGKNPFKKQITDITVPRTLSEKELEFNIGENDKMESSEVTLDGERKKRRGRNKKEKIYFSKKTEEAIVEYNNETCDVKRNKIYETKIKFSFDKLVENIFNTFKFTYFDSGPSEIQKETVSHLVSNIHKFQAGKGKAFSYFSIVAKNYLIFHNNNNYKRYNQHVDISDTPSESSVCLQTEDTHHVDVQNQEFMKLLIEYWEKNITKIFTKSKDLNIAYAVIELFRNCDRIENFNKKTLYLYIRELSNCKTQQITKIINKMKSYQNVIAQNYCDNGSV